MKFWDNRVVGPIKAISPTTGKIIEVYPQRDARIGSDLNLELRRMSGLLSWWVQLRVLAKKHLREMKHEEYNVSEDLYAEQRAKNPKATESTIKMAVKVQPKMRKAFKARMEAKYMYEALDGQVDALWEKHFSLQALTKTMVMERGAKDYA